MDPFDETLCNSWRAVDDGIAFPRAHCAFNGCRWTTDEPGVWEKLLKEHIEQAHGSDMDLEPLLVDSTYDYYCAAVQHREEQGMPTVGPSIDRRTFKLLSDVCNDKEVYNLVCFVCAQVKTHTGLQSTDGVHLSAIRLRTVSDTLHKWHATSPHMFNQMFSLSELKALCDSLQRRTSSFRIST